MPTDNESWKAQIEERLAKLEERFDGPPSPATSAPKMVSMADFVKTKKPKTEVEFLVTIIGYSEAYEHVPRSTNDSVKDSFHRIKQPTPKNLADVLYKAINRRLVMEVPNPEDSSARAFQLTATGEKLVETLGDQTQ